MRNVVAGLLVFPPFRRRIVVVTMRVAIPGVGVGFGLRFLERAIGCFDLGLRAAGLPEDFEN